METEIWKAVEGFEGLYEVSNIGRVKSLGNGNSNNSKERILKQARVKKYWKICLSKNGRVKFILVHTLVGKAFIPNPENLPEINHINENGLDNRAENLEWISHRDNCNYGTRNKRSSENRINHPLKSKKVLQFTKEGEFIIEYPSTMEAERQTKINHCSISRCCSDKKYKSAGGFIWRYA